MLAQASQCRPYAMPINVHSATLNGIRGALLRVEVDILSLLPTFLIVGLPQSSVRESRERVRSAIRSSELPFPRRRITVNLAPADQPKHGTGLDLPIALGVVGAAWEAQNSTAPWSDTPLAIGELGLAGEVQSVRGILPLIEAARASGVQRVIVPAANVVEARLVPGIEVHGVRSLREAWSVARGKQPRAESPSDGGGRCTTGLGRDTSGPSVGQLGQFLATEVPPELPSSRPTPDLADVRGLTLARRALEIAAVGEHGLLLEGPPGSGKSMLARCLPGLLPTLDPEDALVVTRIRSSSGLLGEQLSLLQVPPLRAPHHSSSTAALIGGGNPIRPGEVTLAHRGVLLLDEAPEFRRDALEALRQPLQDGEVTIARRGQVLQMPADFQLVATRNPCPCGLHGSRGEHCRCSPAVRSRYLGRLSGPLLDRLAISVWVDPTPLEDVLSECSSEPSSRVAERVAQARSILRSQKPADAHSHPPAAGASELTQMVELLSKNGRREFERQVSQIRLSTRRLGHLLKVAQSIAALDHQRLVEPRHVIEAAFFSCRAVGEDSGSAQRHFSELTR